MKNLWKMMVAALVIIGATACTESEEGVDKKQEQSAGVSFYATIGDDTTRAYIDNADGDKTWSTVWEEGDTLVVHDDTYVDYTFVCTDAATGKFTCSDSEAVTLVGKEVTIRNDYDKHERDSRLGKKALSVRTTGVEFTPDATIQLSSDTSFFRYTYEGEGDVTLKLTLKSQMGYDIKAFMDNGNFCDEITFSGIKGENFVPFWCGIVSPEQGVNATLSYAIDGVIVKQTTIKNISAGKVYNLGELGLPYETSAYSVVGTHNNWAAGQTPMYIIGDYCVAYGVEFAAAENKFKVLGPNDKWLGANALTVGKWTAVSTDGGDITIAAGAYDIYFSEAESKICVVAAGTEVPAMPVFSVGVIGLGGNWDVDKDMTLEGDYYTLKGVDVAATDSFKLRISDDWAENYGIASSTTADFVAIEKDTMYSLVQDGKNMQVAAGTYDLYFNYATKEFYALTPGTTPDDLSIPQYKVYVHPYNNVWTKFNLYSWDTAGANPTGAWPGTATTVTETINGYTYYVWTMPRSATGASLSIILNDGSSQTADFALGTLDKDYYLLLNGVTLSFVEDKENPEPEVVQGEPQPSTWALAGDFNSWGDLVMYTTDVDGLFVAKGVNIGAYKEIKIKQVGNWNTSYGGGINYLNANIWTKVYSGGSNLSIINAGKYDIYFDNTNKRIYVMTEGTDYATATEQSANGAAPDLSGASWGLCGSHNNWSAPDIKLEWDGTIGLYVALNAKLTGEFKVRANNSWGEDYGCGGTITVNATAGKAMSRGGGNCKVASGTYDVYFDLASKKIWVKTPGSAAPTK